MVDSTALEGQEPVQKTQRIPSPAFILELISSARLTLEMAQKMLAKHPEFKAESKRLKLTIDTVSGAWQRIDYRRRKPIREVRKRAEKLSRDQAERAGKTEPT